MSDHDYKLLCSTGHPELDAILGTGGWPQGIVIDLFGPEDAQPRLLGLYTAALRTAEHGVLIDVAHRYERATSDRFMVAQPSSAEQAFAIIESLMRASTEPTLFVVDDVQDLLPRDVIDGLVHRDDHLGLQARLMSQALRRLTSLCYRAGHTVMFINQLRQRIGGVFSGMTESSSLSNALKFYSSIRIDVRCRAGEGHYLKVVKNKCGVPFKSALLPDATRVASSKEES